MTGIGLAYFLYVVKPGTADSIAAAFGGLYKLVYNKYFVDEIYDAAVVKPTVEGSRAVLWRGVDVAIIDGVVNGVASFNYRFYTAAALTLTASSSNAGSNGSSVFNVTANPDLIFADGFDGCRP